MIMPVDIQNKDFSKKIKGYDCNEVDDFLDEIIKDYSNLLKENQSLKNRVGMLTKTVENYKALEDSLTKSVDMAKQTAKGIKDSANSEAQMIINNAKLDASRLAKQIDDEHIKRHNEMLRIKSETEMYKTRLKSLCQNMIQMLDDAE
ncbi:MAG: DivIVA domain-containing protein [Clostridia bacterium]|nr:DivIVA domain-containing protein [Clostridia bacterium]